MTSEEWAEVVADLQKEIARLRALVRAHQLEAARLREALHIADFEALP